MVKNFPIEALLIINYLAKGLRTGQGRDANCPFLPVTFPVALAVVLPVALLVLLPVDHSVALPVINTEYA